MTIQTGANLYTQGFGSRPEGVEVPYFSAVSPSTTNTSYPLGKRWINTVANAEYSLTSFSALGGAVTATWTLLGAGSGELSTITTQDSTVVTPSAGNINLSGASPLSTTGSGSTATINLSGTVSVAHGGTGAVTLTGVLTGNGTSAVTANAVTQHGVVIGGASNAVGTLSVASTGQTLMGSTGADPAFTGSPSFSGAITAATGATITNGNLTFGSAGNKVISTSVGSTTTAGANSYGTVALGSGTATVATSAVTSTSMIFLTCQALGTVSTPSALCVSAKTASTSFVITASQNTDTSTIAWFIVN